jgi:FeS assembly SUF system protein
MTPMDDAADIETTTATPLSQAELDVLTDKLIGQLKTVFDPEIPVDIYELGLIYKVDVADNRDVSIEMTLTAPGCPVAGEMPTWVRDAIRAIPDIGEVRVRLVFDPPWDSSLMSDEAKLQLNMF